MALALKLPDLGLGLEHSVLEHIPASYCLQCCHVVVSSLAQLRIKHANHYSRVLNTTTTTDLVSAVSFLKAKPKRASFLLATVLNRA